MLILNNVFRSRTESLDILASVSRHTHPDRDQSSQKGSRCAFVLPTHTKDLLPNPVTTITTRQTDEIKTCRDSACLRLNFPETALRWWPCPDTVLSLKPVRGFPLICPGMLKLMIIQLQQLEAMDAKRVP